MVTVHREVFFISSVICGDSRSTFHGGGEGLVFTELTVNVRLQCIRTVGVFINKADLSGPKPDALEWDVQVTASFLQ